MGGVEVKTFLRTIAAIVVVAAFSPAAEAQNYPMPGSITEPAVRCTTCLSPYTNLPTAQYTPPLKRFVGRFMDGHLVRAFQGPTRTYRARGVWVAPERDRVYMMFGAGTFVSYKLSTFFTQDLGRPMVRLEAGRDPAERYLDYFGSVDPQRQTSGWLAPQMDGQDRLFWVAYDDRNYVYLAYGPWGWGIVQDSQGDMPLVRQINGESPDRIEVVKVG